MAFPIKLRDAAHPLDCVGVFIGWQFHLGPSSLPAQSVDRCRHPASSQRVNNGKIATIAAPENFERRFWSGQSYAKPGPFKSAQDLASLHLPNLCEASG